MPCSSMVVKETVNGMPFGPFGSLVYWDRNSQKHPSLYKLNNLLAIVNWTRHDNWVCVCMWPYLKMSVLGCVSLISSCRILSQRVLRTECMAGPGASNGLIQSNTGPIHVCTPVYNNNVINVTTPQYIGEVVPNHQWRLPTLCVDMAGQLVSTTHHLRSNGRPWTAVAVFWEWTRLWVARPGWSDQSCLLAP